MDELLTVARQLRPTSLDDLGLSAAIAGQIEQLERQARSKPPSSSKATLQGARPDVQLVIYRVAQESSATRSATAVPTRSTSA